MPRPGGRAGPGRRPPATAPVAVVGAAGKVRLLSCRYPTNPQPWWRKARKRSGRVTPGRTRTPSGGDIVGHD